MANLLSHFNKQLPRDLRALADSYGFRSLGKEIGVSAATLCRISNGKQPSLRTFIKIYDWWHSRDPQIRAH